MRNCQLIMHRTEPEVEVGKGGMGVGAAYIYI